MPFTGADMIFNLCLSPCGPGADGAGTDGAVILNLVNAHDAMPDGGQITIRTQVEEVARSVPADAGPGRTFCCRLATPDRCIEESVRPHILEPFLPPRKQEGTGLGLSTVYAIVTRSHGRIELRRSRQGTTFLLYLPAIAGSGGGRGTGAGGAR